jgi:hypothetical protein
MTFRIGECSSCGASYKLPESFTASRAKCKKCGGVVEIGKTGGQAPASSAPPVPARKPGKAAASGRQPKQKREGPTMKERLLAQRREEEAKQKASAGSAPSKTKASSVKAAAPAAAKADTKGSGRSRPSGGRTRSSRRNRDEQGGEDGAGRRRQAPQKKQPPILAFSAAMVLLLGIGGGSYWFLNKGDDATEEAELAKTSADDGLEVLGSNILSAADTVLGQASATEGGDATDASDNDPEPIEAEVKAEKPKKKPARAGDPDSVDLTAIADFGPIAGCGEERFAELQELAATMVDPMAGAAGNRAKRTLLEAGKESFPVIYNALKAQDLTDDDGFRNADVCQKALEELCNGNNFGWKYPSQEPDKFHYFDKKVIVSWSKAWDKAKDNDGAWAKLAKLDKVDTPAETEEVIDDETEDALDALDDF